MTQCGIEISDQQTIHLSLKKRKEKEYGKLTYIYQSDRNTIKERTLS
jgi:hypothetical protein